MAVRGLSEGRSEVTREDIVLKDVKAEISSFPVDEQRQRTSYIILWCVQT